MASISESKEPIQPPGPTASAGSGQTISALPGFARSTSLAVQKGALSTRPRAAHP